MNYKLNNRGERKKRQSVARKKRYDGAKNRIREEVRKIHVTLRSREHAKISRINKERKKYDITNLDRHLVQYHMVYNLMEAIKVNFLNFFLFVILDLDLIASAVDARDLNLINLTQKKLNRGM